MCKIVVKKQDNFLASVLFRTDLKGRRFTVKINGWKFCSN
jgi:hypothetical protein